MNKYRVLLNGKNFLINFEGEPKKLGFYTTRYVEAANSEEAETIAVDMLRQDDKLIQMVLNQSEDPPIL